MFQGATPASSTRWAMRWTITRVLPEPGPATISSGPRVVVTASRWAGLRPSSARTAVLPGEHNWPRGRGPWRAGPAHDRPTLYHPPADPNATTALRARDPTSPAPLPKGKGSFARGRSTVPNGDGA